MSTFRIWCGCVFSDMPPLCLPLPLNITALDANATIAMIQVALSVSRCIHTLVYMRYMWLYGASILTQCSPDGTLVSPNDSANKTPCVRHTVQCVLRVSEATRTLPHYSCTPTPHTSLQRSLQPAPFGSSFYTENQGERNTHDDPRCSPSQTFKCGNKSR